MNFVLALLMAGCTPASGPADPGPRWLQADQAERQAIIAEIDSQPTPEAALALLEQVNQAAPGTLRQDHCQALHTPSVAATCTQMADRPHLATRKQDSVALAPAVPWPPLRPPPGRAGHATLPASLPPSLRKDATTCNALAGQAHDECWFRAGERAAGSPTTDIAVAAVFACFAAGDFVHECLSHAVDGWTAAPPAPNDPVALDRWNSRLAALSAAVHAETQGPEADTFDDVLRACATERLVRLFAGGSGPWPGRSADLRASLAARLLQSSTQTPDELGALAQQLNQVLAGMSRLPLATTVPDPPLRDMAVLWDELLPTQSAWLSAHPEATIVPYRGYSNAVRITVEDPALDASISILEAAARATPPRWALLCHSMTDKADVVAWTAIRLSQALGDTPASPKPDICRPPAATRP